MAVAMAHVSQIPVPSPPYTSRAKVQGWEDQIVPTLKRRLEAESAYISHRLSTHSFADAESSSSYSTTAPATSLAFPRPTSPEYQPQQGPSSPRQRLKSTPLSLATKLPTPTGDDVRPRPTRRPSASPSSTSSSPNPSQIPSRIPTRPRSKSQLGPRPPRNTSTPPPPLPSHSSPSRPLARTPSASPGASPGGRVSPDLNLTIREGFIKNELPPFKLHREEAMRIAEKGHELLDDDWDAASIDDMSPDADSSFPPNQRSSMEIDQGRETRKRASSMAGSTGPVPDRYKASQLPRLVGQKGVGLGQPGRKAGPSGTSRAVTQARLRNAPLNSSTGSGARSASANVLGSSTSSAQGIGGSRLGVAAHFIPPENSYTPPKGQRWDDVVLPTVAKKLGLVGDSEDYMEGGEGDLAVEWDKDGIPVRWVKVVARDKDRDRLEVSTKPLDEPPTPLSSSFESPDHPLRHTSPERIRPKHSGSFTPIRTTHGPHTSFDPPLSPAPFSSLGPSIHQHSPSEHTTSSGISRKPSLLKKTPTPQSSLNTLRGAAGAFSGGRGGMGEFEMFSNPRPSPKPGTNYGQSGYGRPSSTSGRGGSGVYSQGPWPTPSTPGTTHQLHEMIYSKNHRREGTYGQSLVQGQGQEGGREKNRGCGCVIM